MLQQRASKRQGDLSPTTPPGDAVDAPRPGGKAGGADGGGAVAGETGIQLMRRDQNRWMEQRLTSRSASGAPPPSPSSAEKGDTAMLRARAWRQEKQARAKQRAEARQEEAAAAEGLPLLLESLGLGDHAPALAARNATLAHLRRIRPPAKTARVFQQSGGQPRHPQSRVPAAPRARCAARAQAPTDRGAARAGLHPKEVARLVKAVKVVSLPPITLFSCDCCQ